MNDYTSLQELTRVFSESTDNITKALLDSGYKKSYEYEADAMALGLLERAGYDPHALVRVLERLPEKEGFSTTHPKTTKRVKKSTHVLEEDGIQQRTVAKVRTERFLRATHVLR